VLCLLFVRTREQVWIAYAVVTAHSIVSAFFDPAQTATFPSLVPQEDLAYAATLENSLWSVTLAIGSALGGLLVAIAGRETGGVLVLLAFFGEKVFDRGNGAGIAILWTARGVGSFLGPFAAFRFVGHDDKGLRSSISWAFALLVFCYVGFALSPAIGWAAAALAVANAGGSILWTSGSTILQRIVPDSIRGRVAAAEMGGFMLALTASTLAVGLLLDRGVHPRM